MSMSVMHAASAALDKGDRMYHLGVWDCAVLVQEYLRDVGEFDKQLPAPPLTVWKCLKLLGRPNRLGGLDYGDVVLAMDSVSMHLGIWLGYGFLTATKDGLQVLAIGNHKFLRWDIGRWAKS